jgi:hypothetical protein
VKRLDGARQGEKQFRAEVSLIGVIQHVNLVKLIGFCCQGDRRLLVYEHMPNGSMDAHVFQSSGPEISGARGGKLKGALSIKIILTIIILERNLLPIRN